MFLDLECWILYVCVGDVIDVVFSVCIMRRGAVGVRVYGKCQCFVMQTLYVWVLFASCVLHDLKFVNAGRGCKTIMEEAYSRDGLKTALYVAMSVFFCLPHTFAVLAFIICRSLCACIEML